MYSRQVDSIAGVLLERWDVLAVADTDVEPKAEYRNEASELSRRLRSGASIDELTATLTALAASLRAPANSSRDRAAAEAVLAAWLA